MRTRIVLGALALGCLYAACGNADQQVVRGVDGAGQGGAAAGAAGTEAVVSGGAGGAAPLSDGGEAGSGAGSEGGEGGAGPVTTGGNESTAGADNAGGQGGSAGDRGQAGAGQAGATGDAIGCSSGTRAGFLDAALFPSVAACSGVWEGDVSNAAPLCANGWHVCLGSEQAFAAVTYADATAFEGCFAFDAAQDGYACYPDCSSRIGTIDTAENIDMGGVGNGCAFKFSATGSCISGGRIDASENNGIGCNYSSTFAGVACCAD